jgi:hypothetical protein
MFISGGVAEFISLLGVRVARAGVSRGTRRLWEGHERYRRLTATDDRKSQPKRNRKIPEIRVKSTGRPRKRACKVEPNRQVSRQILISG